MKDEAFIQHMIDAISQIEKYTEKRDYEEFKNDTLLQDGVIRQMEILGEAAKQVSEKIKKDYQNISWEDAAGMRDRLIHGYFGIDVKIIWNTIENDLPELKQNLYEIKEEEF